MTPRDPLIGADSDDDNPLLNGSTLDGDFGLLRQSHPPSASLSAGRNAVQLTVQGRRLAHFARAARTATGLSQEAFARRASVSVPSLSNIENGCPLGFPTIKTLVKIARASGRRWQITLGD